MSVLNSIPVNPSDELYAFDQQTLAEVANINYVIPQPDDYYVNLDPEDSEFGTTGKAVASTAKFTVNSVTGVGFLINLPIAVTMMKIM
jgi:hypothetical protein